MIAALNKVTVVVLAGGRGTRIQALHPDLPKPMVPVSGRPFLYWLTAWLALHGLTRFVFSVGHRAGQIEAWSRGDDFPALTRICRHELEPLGTGGGLLNCLDLCGEFVLVVNGDGLVMDGLESLLALCSAPTVDGGLIGVAVEDASRFGSLAVSDDGRLTGFREKVPGRGIVNGGLYLFRSSVLQRLARPGRLSIEHDIIPELLDARTDLRVVKVDAPFIDIGTPQTLAEAGYFVETHLAARLGER